MRVSNEFRRWVATAPSGTMVSTEALAEMLDDLEAEPAPEMAKNTAPPLPWTFLLWQADPETRIGRAEGKGDGRPRATEEGAARKVLSGDERHGSALLSLQRFEFVSSGTDRLPPAQRRPPSVGRCLWGGITITGPDAPRTTLSATLPKKARSKPVRPCVLITTRLLSASERMA